MAQPTTTAILARGSSGPTVFALNEVLRQLPGQPIFSTEHDKEEFGAATETALRSWQAGCGLVADGIAGPLTLMTLDVLPLEPSEVTITAELVTQLLPRAKESSISRYLPYLNAALLFFHCTEPELLAAALAIIRVEAEGFVPMAELPSHLNTQPGMAPFSGYESRRKIGNTRLGDGALYRGRGFLQLVGRKGYEDLGHRLGIPLAENPDLGCAPEVAASALASTIDNCRNELILALSQGELKKARELINGESDGLELFRTTYTRAIEHFVLPRILVGATAPAPVTAAEQRAAANVNSDPADLRDRLYTPPPRSLPEVYPGNNEVKEFIPKYKAAGLILDQGREGACTGFGLACVINYLRWRGAGMPDQLESVSPRMLYHFARRYDEYEGENYEGSSCRGALKGWYHNGVCLESTWRYHPGGQTFLPQPGWERESTETTLGIYYRIATNSITDLQAAIHEVGAIYVSAYTHRGWETVGNIASPPSSHAGLPVISYSGVPSRRGGHAFALVGFNRQGFVVQNSWSSRWGAAGFATLTYEDWLAHAMDAWVAAMGVPGVLADRVATSRPSATVASSWFTNPESWWDTETAYRHSVVFGNNGRVHRYDQIDGLSRSLQHQACLLPDAWFRNNASKKKRLVLYAHGGLNSEDGAIARAKAMGRYFLANDCYPIFLVWKSGLGESIGNILADQLTRDDEVRAQAVGGWFSDALSDPLIEKTIGRPLARPLWSEMKENAMLATENGRGGHLLVTALRSLASSWGEQLEIHLMGHSAGSILLGRLLDTLAAHGLIDKVASTHLYAPACTVAFANRHYAVQKSIMKNLYIDILSDDREQEDNVAQIYRKSLLYFVSNALEADPRTPLLGMEKVFQSRTASWDGSSTTAENLANWQNGVEQARLDKRLKIHKEMTITTRRASGQARMQTAKTSHGGFDNNTEVVERSLKRITGYKILPLAVDDLVGF